MCRDLSQTFARNLAARNHAPADFAQLTLQRSIRKQFGACVSKRSGNLLAGEATIRNMSAGRNSSSRAIRFVRSRISAKECLRRPSPIISFQWLAAASDSRSRMVKEAASLATIGRQRRKIQSSIQGGAGESSEEGAGKILKTFLLRTDAPVTRTHPRNEKFAFWQLSQTKAFSR